MREAQPCFSPERKTSNATRMRQNPSPRYIHSQNILEFFFCEITRKKKTIHNFLPSSDICECVLYGLDLGLRLTIQVSWIDYDGKLVPRRSLVPGACYFERSFATHPWVIHHDDSNQRGHDKKISPLEEQQQHTSRSGARTDPSQQQRQRQHHHRHHQELHSLDDENAGECCLVRLGDAMALARLTGSLIWNPTGRTLSITKQAKVGVPGMSAATHASVGSDVTDGAGLDPGMKRLCMAGPRREDEEALARARRATVRKEKGKVLQEMKAWRTHPVGAVRGVGTAGGVGTEGDTAGGLGQGVPNLRVVMIGSSGCHEN